MAGAEGKDNRMTATPPRSLLIVDDDPRNRKLLETLLVADGYAVRSCDSGAAALRSVAERLPDAILLDVMMPGMDGFEVARRLKADPAACEIPLLMVTALDDEASRQRLAAAGIAHVLTKPVDRWHLKARLAALFGGTGDERA